MDGDKHNGPCSKVTAPGAEAADRPEARGAWRRRLEDRIWGTPENPTQALPALVQRWLQIMDRAFHGFISNKGPANAASLTYTTILTIVPLLALLLAVLKGFGVHQMVRESLKQLPFVKEAHLYIAPQDAGARALQPPQAGGSSESITGDQLIDKLYEFVNKTELDKLGFIGVAGLLWAVMAFLSKIEQSMNEAWAVRRSRSWGRKLSDYLNMLVIIILLMAALSTTATGSIVIRYSGLWARLGLLGLSEVYFNAAQRILLRLLPYLIVWIAFILMYFYIPNTRVRWKSAILSGLVAGTIFQLAQVLFIRSQFLAGRYKIYGAFAVILILLVWFFFSWCIVLWGAEVCSAHQNLRDWRRRRRAWRGTPAERETLALRMATLLAAPLLGRSAIRRMDAGDLADALTLPPSPVGEMIELFQSQGLAVQSAEDGSYLLARSPESVSVLDILRLVRQGTFDASPQGGGFLGNVSSDIIPALESRTVKDLTQMPLDDIKSFTF